MTTKKKNPMPSKIIAAALAICFGALGLHKFYLREWNVGVIWIIAAVFLSWTWIVPIFLWVVAIIQGLSYLLYTQEAWEKKVRITA